MWDIWAVNKAEGDDPPTEQLLTAETTIFILHQQSGSHVKAMMFFLHLKPCSGR